jgi:2,3-dihydroxyphenylpropionate 1,2-dioxygenase
MIAAQDWEALDALDTAAVDAVAGSGANELLAWVAASAAMGATGQYRVAQKGYRPAPGWISGVAHLTATGEQT